MVFKSLILSTLYSGLGTMVMSPAEYKWLDVCILGFVRKLMRGTATSKTVTHVGTKKITLVRYNSSGDGWACLRLRLNFALLAWVSFNVRQTIHMVAGPSLLWRSSRLSLGKASPQERARNHGFANVRDSGLHPPQKTAICLDHVSRRRVRSPLLECFQGGAAEHRVSIGCGVDRPGTHDTVSAHSSGATSSRPSGTSRQHQHERGHGGSEAGQNAQTLG